MFRLFFLVLGLVCSIFAREYHDKNGWFSYRGEGDLICKTVDAEDSFVGFGDCLGGINCVNVKSPSEEIQMMIASSDFVKSLEVLQSGIIDVKMEGKRAKHLYSSCVLIEEGQYGFFHLVEIDDELVGYLSFYKGKHIVMLTFTVGKEIYSIRKQLGCTIEESVSLYLEKLSSMYQNVTIKACT